MLSTFMISCYYPGIVNSTIKKLKESGNFAYVAKSDSPIYDILALYHTKVDEDQGGIFNFAKKLRDEKGIAQIDVLENHVPKAKQLKQLELKRQMYDYLNMEPESHGKRSRYVVSRRS